MLRYQYNAIPGEENEKRDHEMDSLKTSHKINQSFFSFCSSYLIFFLGLVIGLLFHLLADELSIQWSQWQRQRVSGDMVSLMHISDTHIDYFFSPNHSLGKGVCHSCELSYSCPTLLTNMTIYNSQLREQGYAFGRYGCNPPHLLFRSLLQQMKEVDPNPSVIVFTGLYLLLYPTDRKNRSHNLVRRHLPSCLPGRLL
jgi:hypothetical protein